MNAEQKEIVIWDLKLEFPYIISDIEPNMWLTKKGIARIRED